MKIMIDGIVRDMTPEEEAAYIAEEANIVPPPSDITSEEALSILLGGDEA